MSDVYSNTCSRCSKPVEYLNRAHCRSCQLVYHQTCVPCHASALLPTHEQWWCPACTEREWQKATGNHCAERCAAGSARVVCRRCLRRYGWACAGLSPVATARLKASPAPWLCRQCADDKDDPSVTDTPAVTTPAAILPIPAARQPTSLPPPLTRQPPPALNLLSTDSLSKASRPPPPLMRQPTPVASLSTLAGNLPTLTADRLTLAVKQPTPAAILLMPTANLPTPAVNLSTPASKPMPESRLPMPASRQPTPASNLPPPTANLPTPASKPMPASRKPKPSSRQPTPGSSEPTPASEQPLPTAYLPTPASKPMPASRKPKPASRQPTPGSSESTPASKQPMPTAYLPTPASKPMPASRKPKPASRQSSPGSNLPMSTAKLPTPASKPMPASRKPKSASRQPTPGSRQPSPASNLATPASNLSTPTSYLPTPASKPMPASRKTMPASIKPLPASRKPKPASRQPTPGSSEPMPAWRQLSPASKPLPASRKPKPASRQPTPGSSKSTPASKPISTAKQPTPASSKSTPGSRQPKSLLKPMRQLAEWPCAACPIKTDHRSKLMCEVCRRQFWMCSNIEVVKNTLQNGTPWFCRYCMAPGPKRKSEDRGEAENQRCQQRARCPQRRKVKIPPLSESCVSLLGSERAKWLERFAKVYTVCKPFNAQSANLSEHEVYRAMGNALGAPDASVDEVKLQAGQFLREYKQLLETLVEPFVGVAYNADQARQWALRLAPLWLHDAENVLQMLPVLLQGLPEQSWAGPGVRTVPRPEKGLPEQSWAGPGVRTVPRPEKALDPSKVLTALAQEVLSQDMTCPDTVRRLARKYDMTPAGLSDIWAQYVRFCMLKLQAASAATVRCPAHLALTPAEWAACDGAVRDTPHPLPWLVCSPGPRRCPLRALVCVARRCSLEAAAARPLRLRRWARALQLYRDKGMTASLMMLQRRWWEMKRETKVRFDGCSAAEVAATKCRGAEASLRLIALRYPYVLNGPLLSWTLMVKGGHIVDATEQILKHVNPVTPLPSSDDEEVTQNSIDLKKQQLQAQMSRELKELRDLNNMQNLNIQTHIDEYEAALTVVTKQISHNKPHKSKNSQDNTVNQNKPHESKNSKHSVIDFDRDSVEDETDDRMEKSIEELLTIDPKNAEASIIFESESDSDDDRMVIEEADDLTDYNQFDLRRTTETDSPEIPSMVENNSNADHISLEDKSTNNMVSDDCGDVNVVGNEVTDTEVMISSNFEVSKQFDSKTGVVSDDNTTSVVEGNNTSSLVEEDEDLKKCPAQAIIDDRLNPEEDSLCIDTGVNNLEYICENAAINNVEKLTNSDPKDSADIDVNDSVSKDITDNVTCEISETTENLTNEVEMNIENTDVSDGITSDSIESGVNSTNRDNVHTTNSSTENSSNINKKVTSMETEECIEDDANVYIASSNVNCYELITSENVPEVSENVDIMGNDDDLSNVLDINSIDVTEDLDELVKKCDDFIDDFDSIDILEDELVTKCNVIDSIDVSQKELKTKCDDFDSIDVSQDVLLTNCDEVTDDFNSIDVSQDDLLMKCDEVVDSINSIDVLDDGIVTKSDDLNSIDITQDELLTKFDDVTDDINSVDVSKDVLVTKCEDFNSIDVSKDVLVTTCDDLNSIYISEDIIEPCVENLQNDSRVVFDKNLDLVNISNTFIPSPSKDNSVEAKKSVILLGDGGDNDDILAEIAKDYVNVRTNVREDCCMALDRGIPKEDILIDSESDSDDDSVKETGSCTVDPKLLLVPMVPLRRVDKTYLWQHHDGSSVDLRQAADARQRRRAEEAEELAALVAAYRSSGAPITGRLSQLRRLCRPCGVSLSRLGAAQRQCHTEPLQAIAGHARPPTRGYIKELRKRLYSAVREAIDAPAVTPKSSRTRSVAPAKSSRTSSHTSDDYSDSDQEPLSKLRRTDTEGGTGLDDWIRERNVNQRFFSLLPASSLTPKIPPIFQESPNRQISPNGQTPTTLRSIKEKLLNYAFVPTEGVDNVSRKPHLHHSYAEHKENLIKKHTTRIHTRQIVATPNTNVQPQVASNDSATKPVKSHNQNSGYVNPPYKILTLDATRNEPYTNLISLLSSKVNSSIYANNSVSVNSQSINAGNQSKTEDGDSPTNPVTSDPKNMGVNEGNHSSNTEDGDTSTKLVIKDPENVMFDVGNHSTNREDGDSPTKFVGDPNNMSVNAGNHTTNLANGDTPTKLVATNPNNMSVNEGNHSTKREDCDTPTKFVGDPKNMSVDASNLSTIKEDSDSRTKPVSTDPKNTSVNASNQSSDFNNSSKLRTPHPKLDKSLSMEPQAVNIIHPPKLMTVDSQDLDIKPPLNLQSIKTEKTDSAYVDKSNQCTQKVDGIKSPWAFPINAGNPHGIIQPGNPHCISQPLKPCKVEDVNQPGFVLSNQNTNVPIIQTQPQNVVALGNSGTVMHTTNYYMVYPQNTTYGTANQNPTMVILPVTVSINPPQIINTGPVKPEVGEVMKPQMVTPVTPQVYQTTSMGYGKPQMVAPVTPQVYQTTVEFGRNNTTHSKGLKSRKHSQINEAGKQNIFQEPFREKLVQNLTQMTRSVTSKKTKKHKEKDTSCTSKNPYKDADDMPVISNVVSLAAGGAAAGESVVISDDSDSDSSPEDSYVVSMRAPSPLFPGPARRISELPPCALPTPYALLRLDDAPVWTLSTGEIMVTEAAVACRRARYYAVAVRGDTGQGPARLSFRRERSGSSAGRDLADGVDEDDDTDSDEEGMSMELVTDKNKLFKRLCDKPPLYARVLTGVTDVMLASRLLALGFAVHAYSRRADALTPLRALPGRVLASARRALSEEVARGFNKVQKAVGRLQGYKLQPWSVGEAAAGGAWDATLVRPTPGMKPARVRVSDCVHADVSE